MADAPSALDVALDRLWTRCAAHGLDLHAATTVGRYGVLVDEPFRLPGADDRAVAVVGNTRALWPHVEGWVREHPDETDPVDALVEHVVGEAVADLGVDVIDVRFAHEPPPRRIAIQRLADVAGLAWLAPSHLCVHPVVGPWLALRAAVVLDVPGVAAEPAAPACDCAHGCLPALDRALAATTAAPEDDPLPSDADVRDHWRQWVAMRDACPLGREHRYSDEQIRYHYVGERPAGWPALGTVGS